MTSWNAPDYDVKLDIDNDKYNELIELSGNTFSLQIFRRERKRAIGGMLIIPEFTKFENHSTEQWAWLWIDSKKAIVPLDEEVTLTLIGECNPMYQFDDELDPLRKKLPVSLKGRIYGIEKFTEQEKDKVSDFLQKEVD